MSGKAQMTDCDWRLAIAVNAAELQGHRHFAAALCEVGRRWNPAFWTVTGRDFGRSIAWARRTPNRVSEQIEAAKAAATSNAERPTLNAEQVLHEQVQEVVR